MQTYVRSSSQYVTTNDTQATAATYLPIESDTEMDNHAAGVDNSGAGVDNHGTGVDNESYLPMTSPTQRVPPQALPFNAPEQTKMGFEKPVGQRAASVRYTKEPKSTSDDSAENASLMTEAVVRNPRNIVERSVSAVSRVSGPGWRSNMKGDYVDLSPICTKVWMKIPNMKMRIILTNQDLLCWAYQVTRGMEYLASKKVSQF